MVLRPFKNLIKRSRLFRTIEDPIYRFKGRVFDWQHGVRTAPEVELKELEIESPNAAFGVKHAGTEPIYFRRVLSGWDIDYRKYTFVDFGSGMGRALLMASEYPFKKIIGVEFSKDLAAIAQQNLKTFKSKRQKCSDIEVICQDATLFEPPAVPSVFYFYDPFYRSVFQQVISNIERSLTESPRDIFVLYMNPAQNDMFLECKFLEQIDSGPCHALHEGVIP